MTHGYDGTPEGLRDLMRVDWTASEEQWRAITAELSPTVVVAGAGSGKTSLMSARVVHLVASGQVRPEQILGLTFTTKAAAELRARILRSLSAAGLLEDPGAAGAHGSDDSIEPTVATYNAYAASLLTDHGLRIGHEPDTRVLNDASRYQLGARVVERHTADVRFLSDHPQTVIQNLLALDAAMSEHLVGVGDVREHDQSERLRFVAARDAEAAGKDRKTYREVVEKAINTIDRRGELLDLVASYRRLKADLGLMDFSDQIELAARLAVEQPGVGRLERDRYPVVLLDEYQDTSVAQAIMLGRLFSGAEPTSGRGHAVMAVGDPNQAIYGWRGASVSNILHFDETFPVGVAGDVPTMPLSVNRRSGRRILEVANRLAEPLYSKYAGQVARLAHDPTTGPGEVATRVFETRDDELAWLADAVRAAHSGAWSEIGVLTRDNAHAAEVYDALTMADVPVEIVGLSGLIRLPEVAEVVAVLHLLQDLTANASVLTLLTGPRWAIGPRDLRLLSERAWQIAGSRGRPEVPLPVEETLVAIADGVDPAEIPALADALDSPGDGGYSAEALERFALLAEELRVLRTHVGEPLLDLVRRVIDTVGVDVELASSVHDAAAARRDNLDMFVKAVAEFQAVDGDVTLSALLAYLTAEDDQGNGLDLATPSAADSVKLLTVHRSKGLEWETVFLVGVCETRFPTNTGRTLWVSSPSVLPSRLRKDAVDLEHLAGQDKAAIEDYRRRSRAHDQEEERRLGYVAFTRAASTLWVTSYLWSPRKTPFGPSDYQVGVRDQLRDWGDPVPGWLDRPEKGAPNPYAERDPSRSWPVPGPGVEASARRAAAGRVRAADPSSPDGGLSVSDAALVAQWDAESERLLAEARDARADVIDVPLPSSLSASALTSLRADPEAFTADLARPMPHPPAPAARFGTRFHAWLEARFGQQQLLDPDELSGRADLDVRDEADLQAVVEAFERGPFADRVPHRVEAPFALVLDGQVVRGRIDAVYEDRVEGRAGFLVVDWKTNRQQTADPLQLAIYRVAWAELAGVPVEQVRAGFFYVRHGELVEHTDLPAREELRQLVSLPGPQPRGRPRPSGRRSARAPGSWSPRR